MSSQIDPSVWSVSGMSQLSGPERERREALARACLERLRSEVAAMPVAPRSESLGWAVDELNEIAGYVEGPETPRARRELERALAEVVEKLRGSGRPLR